MNKIAMLTAVLAKLNAEKAKAEQIKAAQAKLERELFAVDL
jgi:hypothetical protein